jgi:peptidoglycan hydrolase-like protein with peptidoglycan-binding domain
VNRSAVASLAGLVLVAGGALTSSVPLAGAAAPVAAAVKVLVKFPAAPAGLPSGIEPLTRYVPADSCDARDKPGSAALGRFLKATYPGSSYGVSRSCGTDGLSTTEHFEGRAVDWMSSARVPQQKANAEAVISWLLAKDRAGNPYANARRLGVMYVIWNNKIWGAYRPGDGWRPYQSCGAAGQAGAALDTNCHRDHVHLSLSWEGAMGRTSFWTKKVAAPDYGPCRVAGLNWAASHGTANPRPCPSTPVVKPEAGSSALHASLVRSSGLTVKRGSSGAVVVLAQKLVGAAPDGAFGALTEAKVRAFQKVQRVPATGVFDHPTWRAALKVTAPKVAAPKVAAPKVAAPKVAAPKVAAPKVAAPKVAAKVPVKSLGGYAKYAAVTLRRGSAGSVVRVLQTALRVGVDGKFGPVTEAKVRAFQKAHRLTQSGVVTAPVWRAFS